MQQIQQNKYCNFLKIDTINGGVVLIDKPSDWTSHDVVAKIRSLTKIKKVGHSGTLDPLATGLLIVLIGKKHTKTQDDFLKMDKEYLCTAQFGITTDTYDITGEIIRHDNWTNLEKLSKKQITSAQKEFLGIISQQVPPFSAVKVKGKKLYQLARKNDLEKIDLPIKKVKIHKFRMSNFLIDYDNKIVTADFSINCSSGTYIRSLIHDLGEKLGVGATITMLRRTKIDNFSVDQAIKMTTLLDL